MSRRDDPLATAPPSPADAIAANDAPRATSIGRPWRDPAWRTTALIGGLLLSALLLALAADDAGLRVAAIALAVAVLPLLAALFGPAIVRALRGADGAAYLSVLPILGVPLLVLAAERITGYRVPGLLVPAALLALCGLVLVSSDLHRRAQGAGVRAVRSPWRQMTRGEPARIGPWRVVLGVAMVGGATCLALVALEPYVSGERAWSLLELGASGAARFPLLLIGVVVVGAAVVVGLPLLIGATATADRNRLARSHEDERTRLAAHLHDSVLQTLSLVQRQAADPAAVTRLARHQERELRAWLAGQTETGEDTLAGALHGVIEGVETEQSVTIEATVLGDVPLEERGETLAAATREALRNAARHAPGATIVVFAELAAGGAEVYVSDDGPGFDPTAVPLRRRGLRDSIVARMASVGGSATIDSTEGEGTEVALRLPASAGSVR